MPVCFHGSVAWCVDIWTIDNTGDPLGIIVAVDSDHFAPWEISAAETAALLDPSGGRLGQSFTFAVLELVARDVFALVDVPVAAKSGRGTVLRLERGSETANRLSAPLQRAARLLGRRIDEHAGSLPIAKIPFGEGRTFFDDYIVPALYHLGLVQRAEPMRHLFRSPVDLTPSGQLLRQQASEHVGYVERQMETWFLDEGVAKVSPVEAAAFLRGAGTLMLFMWKVYERVEAVEEIAGPPDEYPLDTFDIELTPITLSIGARLPGQPWGDMGGAGGG